MFGILCVFTGMAAQSGSYVCVSFRALGGGFVQTNAGAQLTLQRLRKPGLVTITSVSR